MVMDNELAIYAGTSPTNVTMEQVSIITVRVTWTAPAFAPPVGGYQVDLVLGSQSQGSVIRQETSATILVNGPYGMYVARVMSLSQHLPGQTAESEEVAVLGEDY